jgi:DNA-binding HxlR family transcriptional regulator
MRKTRTKLKRDTSRIKIKNALAKRPKRFNELKKELEMSSRTISKHLKQMEESGEVRRVVLPNKSGVYFQLTDKTFQIAHYVVFKEFNAAFLSEVENAKKEERDISLLNVASEWMRATIVGAVHSDDSLQNYVIEIFKNLFDVFVNYLLETLEEKDKELEKYMKNIKDALTSKSENEISDILGKLTENTLKMVEEIKHPKVTASTFEYVLK